MSDLSNLCGADEDAAFAWLQRAIPVLCGCGILPPTLSLLDSMNKHPNAYGLGDRPGMAALAAEWAAPYQTQANDGDGPKTTRELVLAALGDKPDGELEMIFRTFANDETENWNLDATPLAGVPIFGLYAFKQGERTYCCSLTPSSWAIALENVPCYPDQETAPKVNRHGQTAVEAYLDSNDVRSEALEDCYFGFFGDAADLDRREAEHGDVSAPVAFDSNAVNVDLSKLADHAAGPASPDERNAFADFATLRAAVYKTAAADAWETAREYFSGNQVCPRVILAA
jgi:hypothetical protein